MALVQNAKAGRAPISLCPGREALALSLWERFAFEIPSLSSTHGPQTCSIRRFCGYFTLILETPNPEKPVEWMAHLGLGFRVEWRAHL